MRICTLDQEFYILFGPHSDVAGWTGLVNAGLLFGRECDIFTDFGGFGLFSDLYLQVDIRETCEQNFFQLDFWKFGLVREMSEINVPELSSIAFQPLHCPVPF